MKTNPQEGENENQDLDDILSTPETFGIEDDNASDSSNAYAKLSLSELHEQLETAVQNEDYEKAANIRDEISKRES